MPVFGDRLIIQSTRWARSVSRLIQLNAVVDRLPDRRVDVVLRHLLLLVVVEHLHQPRPRHQRPARTRITGRSPLSTAR